MLVLPHGTSLHEMMEAEIAVMLLRVKQCQEPLATPEAGRSEEASFPRAFPGSSVSTWILDSWSPGLWEKKIVLSNGGCDNLL